MAKKHKRQKFVDWIMWFMALGFFFGGAFFVWAASLKMPSFDTLEKRQISQSTKIYDRTGEILLYDVHNEVKRTIVPFEDISRHIKNATVAIEDSEFYNHIGIRPISTIRAVLLQPLRGKGVQGGSTITQQVVKNSLLTKERKISRKLKEWILALKLDSVMSKEDILGIYLNESPYGGSIYGVEEAARAFFGVSARDVTLSESAYLAALPKAPTYYSPYGNNKEELVQRKNLVLKRMREIDFINEEEYKEAISEEVIFEPPREQGILAPHFVIFIRSYLEERYGKDAVENGGLKVITTLDYDLQKKGEDIVKKFALTNKEKFNAENAGLVAIDPKTGQIITMVGSRDYFDKDIDGNFNITLAKRQPGSAFKPFVYATAFKKGYTPDTVVFDLETQFETSCDTEGKPLDKSLSVLEAEKLCYAPVNYDGVYHGPITLKEALAQSINVPAIKTLYLSGLRDSLRTAQDLGISTLTDVNRYGLTLVLGGGEVTLLDITSAYGVFANNGIRNKTTGILKIEDSSGNIIEKYIPNQTRVIDENIALQISDILSDNEARTPAFGAFSPLYFPGYDVAAKTGTTNDYRDAWTIGYSQNISVGAWAGNNDNSSMEKKVAGFIITPLWNEFMLEALSLYKNTPFDEPIYSYKNDSSTKPILRGVWLGGSIYTIDTISGKLATEWTPKETRKEVAIPDVHSILYWVDKDDPRGINPDNPEKDPQFNFWETSVQKWASENNLSSTTVSISIPSDFDSVHTENTQPKISIISPNNEDSYGIGTKISILPNISSSYKIVRVDYFLNGVFLGSSSQYPFSLSFLPSDIESIKKENVLTAVVYDSVKNRVEKSEQFMVLF